MATKKEVTQTEVTKDKLVSMFMEHVLLEGKPESVFSFCKHNEITESDFYNFFGSIDGLQKSIWVIFYEHVETLMFKNEDYINYSNREKLLTLYFTFFEMLTANRSYVLWSLNTSNNKLENLKQLSNLRKKIVEFGKRLVENDDENKKNKITKKPMALISEAVWVQYLFLLKFWMDDSSVSFEKTDVAIEKSVNTVFDILDNTPLESILDLGKFIWKEKMA